jgi:hypothetical protein
MHTLRQTIIVAAAALLLTGCGGGHFTAEQQARIDARSARHAEISGMLDRGDHTAATVLLVAFWIESTNPDRSVGKYYYGNLLPTLRQLAREHPPARRKFLDLYALLESQVLAGEANYGEVSHWLEVNHALEDDEALAAFAEVYAADEQKRRHLTYRRERIFARLIRSGRWDLAGMVLEAPLKSFYAGDPPLLVRAGEVIGALPMLPVAVVLGPMIAPRVSPYYPFDMLTPHPRPTPDEEAAREHRTLQSAAITGAALTAAGRYAEAAELYRRAGRRVGDELAAAAFSAAYDEAGLAASFPPQDQ